ncbi:MAG TPA: alpha/beta hydrolase [Sphingomonas sp.]|nr:alpha/beta hydrolase [Sphingomonas sp.]
MEMNRRHFAKLGGAAALSVLTLPVASAGQKVGMLDPLRYVDPELRPAARLVLDNFAKMPPLTDQSIVAARAWALPESPLLPEIPIEMRKVPVAKGVPDVAVYIVNAKAGEKRPGILHTHGGGYILGSAKQERRRLQEVARDLDCVILSVEYRLAPETRFTGSIEDNYAGLRWMYTQAAELGIDRARIAVMGESAGGGHAALLALAARDRGEIPLVLQVLVYPMLDDRTGSSRPVPPFIGTILWTAESNRFGWQSFLGQAPGGPHVPAAGVPARVANLEGLAPAFIGVGGVDLFVSEDIDYARRLTEAGVPTELVVIPGAFHGFDGVASETAIAKRFTLAKMNALRRAFGQPIPA